MASKNNDNRGEVIVEAFGNFGIKMELAETRTSTAYSCFMFRLITPTRMKDLDSFDRDLSLALGVYPIRIDAPIPGTKLIGVEVPNEGREILDIAGMWKNPEFSKNKDRLLIPFGRMVGDVDLFVDLFKMPHLLISGSTGSGKSNFIHCLINSLMKKFTSDEIKFILIDNKRVELLDYKGIPHLLAEPIVETKKTINALRWLNSEMERRYELLQQAGAMNINEYNKKVKEKMPSIILIEDEFADDIYAGGERFEEEIVKILQMGRAVGVHVVLSTSRPSEDVISGMVGVNITSRLCFRVACSADSMEVLGQVGAERLLGDGDALFFDSNSTHPVRLQTPFISYEDVIKNIETEKQKKIITQGDEGDSDEITKFNDGSADDDLYNAAKKIVIDADAASASLLQRKLKVGYARAARLLDLLEEAGVVSEGVGAEPRKILVSHVG